MRAISVVLLLCGMLVSLTACEETKPSAPASGASSATPRSENPADVYSDVAQRIDEEFAKQCGSADTPLSSTILQGLGRHRADIERVVEASRQGTCDFRIDFSQGINTKIPHLGQIRSLARVLRADALRCVQDGDADAAARRVAAIVRLAHDTSADGRSLIEWRVAAACAAMGVSVVNENSRVLAAAPWHTDILTALAAVDPKNPLRIKDCLQGERDMLVLSLRNKLFYEPVNGVDFNSLSDQQREDIARDVTVAYDSLTRAWDAPDPQSAIAAVLDGPVSRTYAGALMPALLDARTHWTTTQIDISRAYSSLLAK